ncbi:MAG: fluoride efflux transporter CrcB [Pseudomonadota bacterium]
MIQTMIYVALGGALGAVARFVLGHSLLRFAGAGIPLPILCANVMGSFFMGLAVVYFGRTGHPAAPFVMTGLLGGFTTFSAFSLEAYTLFERGAVGPAAAYVGLSVGASIAALIAGVTLARAMV